MAPPRLELTGVSKAFGGVPGVARRRLQIAAGLDPWLAGENGAGKSTLMKIIAGVHGGDARRNA